MEDGVTTMAVGVITIMEDGEVIKEGGVTFQTTIMDGETALTMVVGVKVQTMVDGVTVQTMVIMVDWVMVRITEVGETMDPIMVGVTTVRTTADGQITVQTTDGEITVQTTDGEITVQTIVDGATMVPTMVGEITDLTTAGAMDQTKDGDILIKNINFKSVD
jgi:hypothetical protein